jgi:glycosyltransferase involved in cell wall biosynthesis
MINNSSNLGTLAVIIMTYNEEENIAQALNSVVGWANEIFILDSFSKDRTLEIAGKYDCHIVQNKFEDFSKQRNFALEKLPVTSEWVLFLDADEWLMDELKREISDCIMGNPVENGFYLNRRFIWMGKWVKHGYYPIWTLRLFRCGQARCEDRAVNEHLIVQGAIGHLKNDYMHEDQKSISDWSFKHIDRARREALELFNTRSAVGYQEVDVRLFGTQEQRKRWLRYIVWNKLPPLIRPIFYFIYRYILAGGFLYGRNVFTYHFLQALWLPMLIDIFYLEMLMKSNLEQSKKVMKGGA